jgi:hypothetical protein
LSGSLSHGPSACRKHSRILLSTTQPSRARRPNRWGSKSKQVGKQILYRLSDFENQNRRRDAAKRSDEYASQRKSSAGLTGADSFLNHRALKLGKYAHDLKHCLSARRHGVETQVDTSPFEGSFRTPRRSPMLWPSAAQDLIGEQLQRRTFELGRALERTILTTLTCRHAISELRAFIRVRAFCTCPPCRDAARHIMALVQPAGDESGTERRSNDFTSALETSHDDGADAVFA